MSTKDNNSNNSSKQDQPNDPREIVKVLLAELTQIPDSIDNLVKLYGDYSMAIEEIEVEISKIQGILHPPKDILSKDGKNAIRLSAAERSHLQYKSQQLNLLLTKLKKGKREIGTKSKNVAVASKLDLKVEEQRLKVKEPNYYKKYGEFLPGAIVKFLNPPLYPMPQNRFDGLRKLKEAVNEPDFSDQLGAFLYKVNPLLYVRLTGRAEAKTNYFNFFKEQLERWEPKNIKVKHSK